MMLIFRSRCVYSFAFFEATGFVIHSSTQAIFFFQAEDGIRDRDSGFNVCSSDLRALVLDP